MDQRPSSLTQVDRNTVVSIEIGRGVTVVVVPDLVGSTTSQARARLAAVKLLYAQQLKASSDADKGKIIAQNASAQSQVRPGSTVAVTVSNNALMVMPGLSGRSQDAVRAPAPRGRSGRVATQSIPAGRPVAADTPLVVSVFTR